MGKTLSEMSLEELWQLFPIVLTENQAKWCDWYEQEKDILLSILPKSKIARISHIGSTSVSTIWAKPIIDILIEVTEECNLDEIKECMLEHGYLCMVQEDKKLSLNKGYTEQGFAEKVFHIHVKYQGDTDELYFRDFLIENPEVAKEYETMKIYLWKEYEHDRDGYTNAKKEFVTFYTNKAKKLYGQRYSS